ncbi:phosphomannomutase/phosphoglucomutase [Candidatus Mesenet endosymbiont of Agriotes lineatus]|uniref:phosphomannomutase/phosphoglucomutase n=1 Tax=Candidatus Mesenet endosymbiont of Agriotes lineatus TaxID=3077948 RepID=UPI0030CCAA19
MILTTEIDTSIIKKYDIRGIIGQNLKVEDGYEIGEKFAQFLGSNAKICVGYDSRVHSPQIEKKVIEGLCFSGASVIRVGLCSSPMLYFATQLIDADGGVMITASHNPAQYNGFKFYSNKIVFSEKEITTFMGIDAKNNTGNYTILNCNIYDQYIKILKNINVGNGREFKIAWNCSNGATSSVIRHIQKILPNHNHITINNTIDGSCNPDPIEQQNLNKLISTTREHQCDIGIALDGDGDRVCVIDSEGHIIPNDYLFMIFVNGILTKGDKVIVDIKSSMKVSDLISRLGGVAITCTTGHSIIKRMMIKENAKFAGELSGHFFFAEIGFDDGIYAAIKLINILQKYENFDSIMSKLPKLYISPEIKIEIQEEKKFQIINLLKKELEQKNIIFSSIDGIKVTFEKGWLLLRASNTQNYITARCEGQSNEDFKEMKNVLDQYIKRIKLLNKP